MLVIMDELQENQEQHVSNISFRSSFSRIRSDELNDMGLWIEQNQPNHIGRRCVLDSKKQNAGYSPNIHTYKEEKVN